MRNITKTSLAFLAVTFCFFTQAQQWQPKTGLPGGVNNARHHPVTWAIGDTGYVLTGTKPSSLASNDFFKYDSNTDTWATLTAFPGAARSFSIGDVYNGEGYLGFGMTSTAQMLNDLWKYNPTTGNWTQLTSCPCNGRRHPTFSINHSAGKIFVGKGDNGQFNMTDWWEYDIASDTWAQLTSFPGVPRHHPFHFSIGDYVYTGLGHGASIYADLHRWDPSTGIWQQMASSPGVRVAGTQFNYNGYGFVLSGDGQNHQATPTSVFWGYDPGANSWFQLPPHPGWSRWAPGSFVINGTVYFLGGEDGQSGQLRSDMMSFDLAGALSVEEQKITFNIFPNPANDVLHITSTQPIDNTTVRILSLDGMTVMETPYYETVSIQNLASGVYIVELTNESGGASRHKLMKQ